jgi:rhodanese-related sulfurtransferase
MKRALMMVLMITLTAAFVMANGQQGTEAVGADSVEAAATAYFAEYPEGGYIIKEDVFLDKVKAGESMTVLDIRQADAYAAGHIEGAVNLPWGPAIADSLSSIPQEGNVYVYCYSGQTAGQTVALLNVAGIPAKSVRYGWNFGISKQDGYEAVSSTADASLSGSYDVDPAIAEAITVYYDGLADLNGTTFANYKVSEDNAKSIFDADDDDVQFVSIRKAEDYANEHIDGAINVPYSAGMNENFGDLPGDKKLIVYCYSGQTAGQTVAILKLLGYDAVSMNGGLGTSLNNPMGWRTKGYPLVP